MSFFVLAVTAAATLPFLPGLAGPFVLDDHANLAPVWEWLAGQRDAWTTAAQNHSGPTGRPLAYLSFMANAALGTSPFGFKLLNLVLHAAASLLVFELLRRVFARGAANTSSWVPAILAAIWAAHPMQASAVLYVVQRMALLGAIAQLATVLLYFEARCALESDPARARKLFFVGIPLALLLGLAAKETIVVAPLLCLAVEATLFAGPPRPREVLAFFGIFLALPVAIGGLWLVTGAYLDAAYLGREFTLSQRLFTEPRVLMDYALQWFWPTQLGLYRDGYPASAGPSFALAACTALIAAAVALRRRAPLFAFGIAWFFAAHALEAGPFPLELFFEHRNYVASLGLAVALIGLVPGDHRWLPHVLAGVLALVAVLSIQRAREWSDLDRLLAAEGPPTGEISRRLQIDRAIRAAQVGDDGARRAALEVLAGGNSGDRASAALWRVIFACDLEGRVDPADLQRLESTPPETLTHNHVSAIGLLARRALNGRCAGFTREGVVAVLDAWQRGTAVPVSAYARQRFEGFRTELRATSQ